MKLPHASCPTLDMKATRKKNLLFVAMVWAALSAPSRVLAQDSAQPVLNRQGKPPAFAVASIRKNISGTGTCDPEHFALIADGFRITNWPMIAARFMAYAPAKGGSLGFSTDGRTVGAPDWMRSEKYDIVAHIDGADMAAWQNLATKKELLHAMMRSLLAERCQLSAHREMREKQIYALVIGKNGPKFEKAESVDSTAIAAKHSSAGPIPGDGGMVSFGTDGDMELYGAPMETLATVLSNMAGRPVEDRTGLTARYDINLKRMQLEPAASGSTQDSELSIFTAIQEQLGLKLESAKSTVEPLVIDHAVRLDGKLEGVSKISLAKLSFSPANYHFLSRIVILTLSVVEAKELLFAYGRTTLQRL